MEVETPRKRKPTGRHPGLRSFDTRLFYSQVYVRFYNRTHRMVDILWVDMQQNYVLYKTLKRLEYYDVVTYVGHPWVFEDSLTRDSMVVNGEEIWWPPPIRSVVINICYPKLSLRCLATRTVRDHLTCVANAMKLDLPTALREDIVMLMKTLYYHKNRGTLSWEEEPTTQRPVDSVEERLILVALKLYDALFDLKEMNVSVLALMSVQVFLQWIQDKVNPHHVAIQALVKVFQTFLDDEETWLEVDPVFIEHAGELVSRLSVIIDILSSLKTVDDVFNFVDRNAVAILTKYRTEKSDQES